MEIFKVRCLIQRIGSMEHHDTDLIFLDGVPHAVIEWSEYSDGRLEPLVKVRLDPKWLKPLPWPGVQYLYELPIADPRPLN